MSPKPVKKYLTCTHCDRYTALFNRIKGGVNDDRVQSRYPRRIVNGGCWRIRRF